MSETFPADSVLQLVEAYEDLCTALRVVYHLQVPAHIEQLQSAVDGLETSLGITWTKGKPGRRVAVPVEPGVGVRVRDRDGGVWTRMSPEQLRPMSDTTRDWWKFSANDRQFISWHWLNKLHGPLEVTNYGVV